MKGRAFGPRFVAAGILFLAAAALFGQTAVTLGKAWLAPVLIEAAWSRAAVSAAGGGPEKPWPWADTGPVLKLELPVQGATRYVLAGATARAMAFGPVLSRSGPLPAVFGHRDTHFAVLADLAPGDPVLATRPDGRQTRYEVVETKVMHEGRLHLPQSPDGSLIALVTCYPFDAIQPGGPLRYVVLLQARTAPVVMAYGG